MVSVVRLVPKEERLRRDTAQTLLAFMDSLPESMISAAERATVSRALFRVAKPAPQASIWPGGFRMFGAQGWESLWDAVRALPAELRPQEVRHALDLCMVYIRQDTGEIMLTREELAAKMGVHPAEVSKAMSVLQRLGAIVRERRRVEGMRGPGVVAYFLNPHIAWNGSLEARAKRAAEVEPPLLRLIEGGVP